MPFFLLPASLSYPQLADILWPKRGRGLTEFSPGSHFVYLQPSFSLNCFGLEHPPFVGQHTEAWCGEMTCLKFIFRQHVKDLHSHASPWINSHLLCPGEGGDETSVPQPEEWDSASSLLALDLHLFL